MFFISASKSTCIYSSTVMMVSTSDPARKVAAIFLGCPLTPKRIKWYRTRKAIVQNTSNPNVKMKPAILLAVSMYKV